ncbi:hypothetical protein C0991_010165 [Blastosporella zonata]|nr:hypothetical protein C0991_010165 [Blastosporella zonata]
MGPTVNTNTYHVPVIRALTRKIPEVLPGLHQEIIDAYQDLISPKDEWVNVKVLDNVMYIVNRVTNFAFVGAPLCRNKEYLKNNIDFTVSVTIGSEVLSCLPLFIRPFASNFLGTNTMVDRSSKHLQPLIEERLQRMDHESEYSEMPKDLLSLLMDAANEEERTLHNLTRRMLSINMAAIHTTSMAFSQAIFDLAVVDPDCVQELRDEIKSVTEREGWTLDALNYMIKVDSFLKESQRLNMLAQILMRRFARQPFTFSDGTTIPAGTLVAVAGHAAHLNEASYDDPHTFQPFRFVEKREQTSRKVDLSSTHTDFLAFGHGAHSCPGRFFASAVLKLMLAHVVMTYDVKMQEGAGRPGNVWYATTAIPDPKAEVLFRKHVEVE